MAIALVRGASNQQDGPEPSVPERVTLPAGSDGGVDSLDHALVERFLLRDALGLDPGDKRIVYVGGDYPADWLAWGGRRRPGRAGRG